MQTIFYANFHLNAVVHVWILWQGMYNDILFFDYIGDSFHYSNT